MTTPINTSLFKKHRLKETQKLLWISLLGVFLGACSSNESTPSESLFNSGQCSRNLNSGSYANTITTEESYCSSPISYVSGETITGKATFQARIVDTSASPTEGLLGPGTAQAIKYAEIIVEDSQGNRVQCAETDSSGSFSFVVPQSVDSLKLRVMARANNSYIKTSVKVCPENESVYSLNTTFSTDGSSTKDIGTVNASATGDLLGGAFNIYNQVLEANSYLRSKVSNCSSTYQGCTDFSVAPKSNIYWEKGFNPNLYFTSDSSATSSFYIPTLNRLFILGGVNGDVNSSDTDHFDNSVILHEYGHFLENQYYTSDSPGGFHSGTSLIDPRLAWSEGWGNFIQGAILNTPYYIDTFGNVDGVTLDIFRVSLEDQTSSGIIDKPCTSCGPNNSHTPEGNFREFAITRALWDIVDNNNDSETVSDAFDQIWATITSNVKGFNENKFKFNSMGAFYERRDALMTASSQSPASWSTIVSLHDQVADRSNYGLWVTPKSDGLSCSGGVYSTTPTDRLSNNIKISALSAGSQADSYIAYSTNFFAYTNLLNNNDFYHYYHGGGPATLTLTYQTASGTTNADLDLYLYKYSIDGQSYVIGDPDYLINYTQGVTVPSGAFGSGQTESLAITDLPAGHYMIHINTYYDSPSDEFNNQTNYELKINTGSGDKYLCPSTFPN